MQTRLTPLGGRLAVAPMMSEAIKFPECERGEEAAAYGRVVSVGPDVNAFGTATGDMILFRKWAGAEMRIEGETVLIIRESDVMAVLG